MSPFSFSQPLAQKGGQKKGDIALFEEGAIPPFFLALIEESAMSPFFAIGVICV
jgi:hypothetical protein